MSYFQVATPFPSTLLPPPSPETGRIEAGRDVFLDEHGGVWSYRGVTMFMLFWRWLKGESIDAQIAWCQSIGANTVRVLGMVAWVDYRFGPATPGWWEQLPKFVAYLQTRGMRIEFTVFADAQIIMPNEGEQRTHLERVIDTIGAEWNVFIEICNEPWKNGVNPQAIFSTGQHRPCPMAYGDYTFVVTQRADGVWIAELPVLDYLTAHTPRDPESWSRKAKDLSEYRDGSGDGATPESALYAGCHIPPVGDEPMGAADVRTRRRRYLPGGGLPLPYMAPRSSQRSSVPEDFFWYVANAAINGAGSTFHCDAGLLAVVPQPGGAQQACAEASALAWSSIAPDYQTGKYTRGGLADLPVVWEEHYFPEQTSRIYGRILGDRACCVAIKPNAGWVPKAAHGWTIAETVGPMDSLVFLVR